MRYVVCGRFGGLIKFTDDIKEAERCASETLGIVYNTHHVPYSVEYDPAIFMHEDELENILNSVFPAFNISVE